MNCFQRFSQLRKYAAKSLNEILSELERQITHAVEMDGVLDATTFVSGDENKRIGYEQDRQVPTVSRLIRRPCLVPR